MNAANISQTWPGANPVSLAGNTYNAEGKRMSRVESNGAETKIFIEYGCGDTKNPCKYIIRGLNEG